jgi:hypothetical protein
MLVLDVFIPICVVSVLFLLRFLFALNSELRSALKPSAARLGRISPLWNPAGLGSSTPVLTLVHPSSGLAGRESSALQETLYQHGEESRLRRA